MPQNATTLILTGACRADGGPVDVQVDGGLVSQVRPARAAAGPGSRPARPARPAGGATVVDLAGYLLLPSFVEPHAHLDKALTAAALPNPRGDLDGAISAWTSGRGKFGTDDIADRAERAVRLLASRGVTAIRTHTDTGPDIGLRCVEALLRVRERLADAVRIQVVACAARPLSGLAGAASRALLEEALQRGADAVGGGPWLDDDPAQAVELLAEAALRHGVPIDAHIDETLEPGSLAIEHLIALANDGFPHRITASHAVSLASLPQQRQRELAERLAAAGVSVVTLPSTNLYLQARGHPVAPPRGIAPVSALLGAGVEVAAGGDNLRDPFNAVGRADPLETASLLVSAAHLRPVQALGTITDGARALLGLPAVAVTPGSPADLVAIRAESIEDAVAFAPEERLVLRDGRLLARTCTRTVWPATRWPGLGDLQEETAWWS